jgi:hypothetical protein
MCRIQALDHSNETLQAAVSDFELLCDSNRTAQMDYDN